MNTSTQSLIRVSYSQKFEESFWNRVCKGDGCWEWTGAKFKGRSYGQVAVPNRPPQKAHRVAWELTNSQIPDGLCVLHKCDNPPCCRPDHLFLGTKLDNNRDMIQKGRSKLTYRKGRPATKGAFQKGQWIPVPRGTKHHNAKLTEELVRKIRAIAAGDKTASRQRIATLVGVTKDQVRSALGGWKHVV